MIAGTSTINSKVNINNDFSINNDIFTIDTFGNIKTKGSLEIDSSIKNIISGELEVNSGITSDNNSIILTADGNLTIASKFVSKDNGTFTNNFFLQDSSLQNFMQMSTDADDILI